MFSGVFASDSDEERNEAEFMSSKRKGGTKDYTAPVSFISGGLQQSAKKKEGKAKSEDDEEDQEAGEGSSKIQNSSDSEEEVRPSFKPQQTAGMRQPSNKGKICNEINRS